MKPILAEQKMECNPNLLFMGGKCVQVIGMSAGRQGQVGPVNHPVREQDCGSSFFPWSCTCSNCQAFRQGIESGRSDVGSVGK